MNKKMVRYTIQRTKVMDNSTIAMAIGHNSVKPIFIITSETLPL